MINIQKISFLEILPPNLIRDPQVKAAAQALDNEFQKTSQMIERTLILPRIDELSEEIIDSLLWQFHLTHNEGVGLAETIEEKRNLVKNAIPIHRYKGTKAALIRVLELLSMRGKITEWWEYGGKPYTFRIQILEVENKGITEEKLLLLDKLISEYKNTRSWLESIQIYLTARGKVYVAGNVSSGETITVYPWSQSNIESKGVIRWGSGIHSIETMTIYPESK